MRRLFALACLALFSLLVPASASGSGADVSVQFRFANSGEKPTDYTPPPGSVISDTWRVVADASAASTLSSFSIVITPQSSLPEPLPKGSSISRTYEAGATSTARLILNWNTNTVTRYNGIYRVVATAQSHGGNSETTTVQDLKVDNPPLQPVNVVAALDENVPVVSWAANPEPDLIHYRVYRSYDGGSFSLIATTTGTELRDSNAPKNTSLRYELAAVRKSSVRSAGIVSPLSKPTAPIVVIPPEPAVQQAVIDDSKPIPVEVVQPKTVMAKQGNLGFAPVLPYDTSDLPVAAQATESGVPLENETLVTQSLPQIVRSTIYKPPFIAAALLLLVTALHVLRIAGRLFSSERPEVSTARILGSST